MDNSDFNENIKLSNWGLPESILSRYEAKGIKTLFDWQVECLSNESVINGKNLIYSAPTSAGKTLVAEILTIKTIIEKNKKAIMILPFVSMVREKMYYFKDIFLTSGFVVEGLMGNQSLYNGIKSVDLAICTIEKANSLINKLLEVNTLEEIGTIIVDELHMLGESFRGYILELMLTKILYMCHKNKKIKIQLIGMSATLPNLDLLAKWLNADLYRTDYRPVPLKEYMKCGSTVYDDKLEKLYDIFPDIPIKDDNEQVIYLCLDTILNGHSILIFCPTKNWCEKLGKHIAQELCKIGFSKTEKANLLRSQLKSEAIAEVLEQLKMCPVGLDASLQLTVSFGVGFHHAGLTIDERDILEGAFRLGILRVLVATSTLSSGVNLPARRVVIRTPLFHGRPLDIHTYRQMIGRAGRKGHDTYGESFLICTPLERSIGEQVMLSQLRPVESSLLQGELADSLKRAILEIVASGVATTPDEIDLYTKCTLVACNEGDLINPITECIAYLEKNELIRLQKETDSEITRYVATALGLACLSASLPPVEGLKLFKDLQRARQCFVLENDLHIIFLVTPLSVSSQLGHIDFLTALGLWEQLPASMKRVGELVGVSERFIISNVRNKTLKKNEIYVQQMDSLQRFYTAMALHQLVNERPLNDVSEKYNINRGMLQALQQTAATFAGMVTAFCKRLGWSSLELLVSQFHDRLQFGIQRELCDLMRLDQLNGPRARALFNAGFTSITLLAAADWHVVENALQNSMPFQSEKKMVGESEYENNKRLKLKYIWITGKDGLTLKDAAILLIEESRLIIQKDLGMKVDWEKPTKKDQNQSNSELTDNKDKGKNLVIERLDAALRNDVSNKTLLNINETKSNLTKNSSKQTTSQMLDISLTSKPELNNDNNISQFNSNNPENNHSILKNESEMAESANEESFFFESSIIFDENSEYKSKSLEQKNNTIESNYKSEEYSKKNNSIHYNSLKQSLINKSEKLIENNSLINDQKNNTIESNKSEEYSKKNNSIHSNSLKPSILDKSEQLIENNSFINEQKQISFSIKENGPNEPNLNKTNLIDESLNENMNAFENSKNLDSFDLGMLDNLTGILENEQKLNITKHLLSKNESSFNQSNCSLFLEESVYHELIDIKEEQIKNNKKRNSTFRINSEFGLDSQFEVTKIKEDESIDMSNKSEDDSRLLINYSNSAFENNIFSFCENILSQEDGSSTPIVNTIKNSDSNSIYIDSQQSETPPGFIKACRNSLLNASKTFSTEDLSELNESDQVFESSYDSNLEKNSLSRFRFINSLKSNNSGNNSKATEYTSVSNNSPLLFEDSFEEKNSLLNQNFISKETKNQQSMHKFEDNSPISSQNKCQKTEVRKIFSDLYKKININQSLQSIKRKNEFSFSSECKKVKYENSISDSVLLRAFENTGNWDDLENSNNQNEMPINNIDEKINSSEIKINSINRSENITKKISQIKNNNKGKIVPESDRILRSDINRSKNHVQPYENNIKDNIDLEAFDKKFTTDYDDYKNNLIESKKENYDNISTIISKRFNSSTNNQSLLKDIEIIDVCKNEMIFDYFLDDLQEESWLCICLDIEIIDSPTRSNIGSNIMKNKVIPLKTPFSNNKIKINGLAISIDAKRSFYISLNVESINIDKKLKIFKEICSLKKNIIIWNAKENFCRIKECLGFEIQGNIWDPLIAQWILNPEEGQIDFLLLISRECPEAVSSLSLLRSTSQKPKIRVCIEAACNWFLMCRLHKRLQDINIEKHFIEVEMGAIKCLAKMELNGIHFSKDEANKIKLQLTNELENLEKKAYSLVGHKFLLSSAQQTGQVLFKELGLEAEKYTSKKIPSTSKEVLLKLSKKHELPEIILEWRKLNFIINKVITPLLKFSLEENKLKGKFIYHTVSGRISMQEPNLQTIPRDFQLSIQKINTPLSLRKAFHPKKEYTLLSVDYCQLELRVLAHFSQDVVLCEALNKETDVFKNIASAWHGIDINLVTDEMRQKSKQLCYGIIYGMGSNTLGEELKVSSEEAENYITSFKQAYPGVQEFIKKTIDSCREKGYIETISGRRRFLPLIKSETKSLMLQAERQAVNSTIQGSAADIAKKGMVKVDEAIKKYHKSINNEVCYPLLHIHDELLFEISNKLVIPVSKIIKRSCEDSWKLSVKLPVKLKCGDDWGSLNEFLL